MKIKKSKTTSLVFTLMIGVMFLVIIYYTYLSFLEYKNVKRKMEYLTLILQIDEILKNIDEERVYSAIYMGTKNKDNFNTLKVYRRRVSNKLENMRGLLKKNKEFSIDEIVKNLDYTRTRVDIFSSDYQNTLVNNYFNKVVKPFIKLIREVTEDVLPKNDKIHDYFKLLNLKEILSTEKSFISFLLNSSSKMNHQDLLLWEDFLENDIVEDLTLKNIRGEIFVNSIDGKYSILLTEWTKVSQDKIDRITYKKNILLKKLQEEIKEELQMTREQTIKYIVLSTTLLMIFIIFVYIFYLNLKNDRLLSDTLNDLEADLDEKQRKEIKEVLKKNDTIAIYKFLVNAIKEPSRAKDHFLANMSHEIRTPLNGIIGFTNILKETDLKEDQKEFVHIIEESSNNLLKIVNDILDFSKVTAGKVEFEEIPFDVIEKFETAVDSYAAKATQKNIDITLLIDPTLPVQLVGDATKISQIIINLLSNAVKFTDKDGQINVAIEKISHGNGIVRVRFSVRDSGIGMTKEQQEKIFDAFSQADASTSRRFGGTGLGLSISSKLVSLMGGKLEVKSEINRGTTFFFSLDLKEPDEVQGRIVPRLSEIMVGYLMLPNVKKSGGKNLKTYVEYFGARFEIYEYHKLLSMPKSVLPNVLFIDYQYINDRNIIISLMNLDMRVVLIGATEIDKNNCLIRDKIARIIYKPINFSKTLKALKAVQVKKIIDNKVTEVKDISSHKVFKNISALIAEDNVINQKLIGRILSDFDISVTLCSNGAEAFKLRKEQNFDIIFMDIQMPVMDGVEATTKIIEYEKKNNLEHVPIVALTANTIDDDKKRFLSAGMDRYLKKPIDLAELTGVIEELFPIEEIRGSIPIDKQLNSKYGEKLKIILFKETELMIKIYTAVLRNLGYAVDGYTSADEFLENLDNKMYKFALFDAKPFRAVSSEATVVELIRDSGAIPIAFIENDGMNNYCETLKPIGVASEISTKLKKCI